jgi:hypothetical protein
MMPEITRDRALAIFAQRFSGSDLTDAEISERFDYLLSHRFLDFSLNADGELRVTMCGRKTTQ